MQIAFPIVISKSGSDVYFQLLAGQLARQGIKAELIPLSHRHEFIPFLSRAERAALGSCDVIHTAAEHGSLVHTSGKPLVLSALHNVLDPSYSPFTTVPQKLYHRLVIHTRQRKALALASAVICISEATRLSYSAMYPACAHKMQVIYPGLDLARFTPETSAPQPPPSGFRILFVGHLTRRKGADLLPAIMDKLGPGHELTCLGQRNTKEQKSTTAAGATIHILPPVTTEALVELYRSSDLLLFPSRLEGFGYAVAEAMACAKPVVAAGTSSIPELIDHEKGGLLCPSGNVDAFATAIRAVLSDRARATAMGNYNRARAERLFSLDRTITEHAGLYSKVLANGFAAH